MKVSDCQTTLELWDLWVHLLHATLKEMFFMFCYLFIHIHIWAINGKKKYHSILRFGCVLIIWFNLYIFFIYTEFPARGNSFSHTCIEGLPHMQRALLEVGALLKGTLTILQLLVHIMLYLVWVGFEPVTFESPSPTDWAIA